MSEEPKTYSIEQFCRDLLELAIADGLVGPTREYADPDPQCRSSGELVRMANAVCKYLAITE